MKIGIDAHTIGHKVTGNETYISNVIKALAKIDKENSYKLYYTNPEIVKNGFINQPNFQEILIKPHSPLIRIPFSFPLEILKRPIDLFHVQYIAPPLCSCPIIVTIHDLSFIHYPQYFTKREQLRMSMLIPITARQATKILAVSEYSKKDIINSYRIPEDKIVVTYDGVNESFHPIDNQELLDEIVAKYGITNKFVLYVGNIHPRKNLGRLIEAYCLLKKNHNIKHKLVIVGKKAWLYADVFKRVREMGLENEIVFTEYVPQEDLPLLYNAAEVFVYPSIFEGFGIPPLESMACGTPVITSNTSSFPEVVGDAGVTVSPHSVDDIAKAIYDVLSNPQMQKRLSEKGIERAKLFTWENTAKRTLSVYKECLPKE
ncbi:MAG: glycosyltransferase family 1 protein [bacterium]